MLFDKRESVKPFEYPDLVKYKKKIKESDWTVDEFNFLSDIQHFHTKLSPVEKSIIKNAILAISQIEVEVKRFWVKIGDRIPKEEVAQVGITFGESEVRHFDAYSHLLEILDLNGEFSQLQNNPVIQGRVDYLTKYLKGASENSNESYALTLTLFSLFIENISLFSQFLIIKSFWKHSGLLKDIDTVIDATMKEEQLHALFGIALLQIMKEEYPEWFNEEFFSKLIRASKKAFDAESKIVDWIFEQGELPFLTKAQVKEFIKARFNESLSFLGVDQVFDTDPELLTPLQWFIEEIYLDVHGDFFNKKLVTYSKKLQPITAEDLF